MAPVGASLVGQSCRVLLRPGPKLGYVLPHAGEASGVALNPHACPPPRRRCGAVAALGLAAGALASLRSKLCLACRREKENMGKKKKATLDWVGPCSLVLVRQPWQPYPAAKYSHATTVLQTPST